jgi:hypothetical protein
MLESVHGIGALLKQGWRPKRTIVFCSWDAEEEGLIGSTEWVEQHAKTLERAVAYFNVDVAVSGPDFSASAVPSLKQFVRELTHSFPARWAEPSTTSGRMNSPPKATSIAPPTPARGPKRSRRRPRLRLRLHALPPARRRALHRHRLRRALRRLSLRLRQLRLVRPERRPTLRLSAGDGPRASALKPCAWPTPTCCPTTT